MSLPSCSRRPAARAIVLAATAALGLSPLGAAPPALTPCALPGLDSGALCATYPVPEDRTGSGGRTIGLSVVVVPATSGRPTREAITFLAGGPGDSSTRAAAFLAHELATVRATRDLVLVDFRGTGGSEALICDELVAAGAQGFLDSFLPTAEVAACRARLAASHDLARYTTEEAVDDIAEVLAAYGYDAVNLYGVSYGTRAAQVFARRHPRLVRTLVLEGAVRMDERDPLDFARAAQNALDALFAECAADAACAAAFPDPAGDLARVLTRLEHEPVTVELVDPASGTPRPLRLSRAGLAQTVRYMLYLPTTSLALPFQLHAAAAGDFQPLAETAQLFASFMTATADGYFLSVICPEDTRFIREVEIAAATAGTFLGDFRVRRQLEACAAWAPRTPDPAFLAPLESAIPTLIVSGERDPVTPAASGDAVARHLARARHLVVPDGAHGLDGLEGLACLKRLTAEFLERADPAALDVACLAEVRRPPFVLAARAAAATLDAAQLASLVGRYRHAETGFELVVETTDSGLRAAFAGRPPFALRPLSAAEFEPVGLPPGYLLRFELDAAGAAVALELIEPGAPPARLPRVE